ncbi:Stress responsive A/B Barrel Domain [Pseudozobellia thermophila]|uniref:Stress responsive A/B Barrel Domain n=2 Tax=Pseudozobellia thermophila TaxID=192903 RepID=A0A1M6MZT6_9FLAO|nr:Stress responsive A/B Barrel Domain [Pseudozobellia thermophila]
MKKLTTTIVFLMIAITSYGQTTTEMREFDPNFAHTVYFWLKNPDSQEDRKAFETSLQKFLDNSAYAKTKFIGKPPKASRDVVDGSFTYSLIVTFESAEAQQNYQDEPPHKLFVEESEKLWSKVIVYDSMTIQD